MGDKIKKQTKKDKKLHRKVLRHELATRNELKHKNEVDITDKKLTKKDKKLLRKPLPDNPCEDCANTSKSCWCRKKQKYRDILSEYRENGVYDIAVRLKCINGLQRGIEILEDKLRNEIKQLPKDARDLIKKR